MYSARANTAAPTTRAPCSQAQFCKELVKAGQCLEGVDYEPDEETREYYDKLVGEQLLCAPSVRGLLNENMPALLDAVGNGDLAIESIAYAPLKPIRRLDFGADRRSIGLLQVRVPSSSEGSGYPAKRPFSPPMHL
jgi:hypothetical protein